MDKLDIVYDVWKNLVNTNSWTTYHKTLGPNRREIYTGNVGVLLRSYVQRDAYDVWVSDFPLSIEKETENDIMAAIIQERYVDMQVIPNVYKEGETSNVSDKHYLMGGKDNSNVYRPLTVDSYGMMLSSANIVQKKEYELRLTHWNSAVSINDSEWTTLYSNSTIGSVFYGSVFQSNSEAIQMKVIINDNEALNLDLYSFETNYKTGPGNGRENDVRWPINNYFSKRWCFQPHIILIISSIQIQFKSNSGNKFIENGMSWWGAM